MASGRAGGRRGCPEARLGRASCGGIGSGVVARGQRGRGTRAAGRRERAAMALRLGREMASGDVRLGVTDQALARGR